MKMSTNPQDSRIVDVGGLVDTGVTSIIFSLSL